MASLSRKGRLYYATWYDPHTSKKRWESLTVFARQRGMLSPVNTPRLARTTFEAWKAEGRDRSLPPLGMVAFLARYREHSQRTMTANTRRVVFNRLELFRRWGMDHGVTHLSDVTTPVLEAFRGQLQCGAVTRHRYIESIRAALNWAVRQKIIPTNPAVGFKREPNYSPKPRRALPDDQVRRILEDFPSPDREFCAMALLAGLRRSDIVYLEWSDIDLRRGVITVQGKPDFPDYTPKSIRYRGKPDEVPITPELGAILKGMPRSGRFVFDNGKGLPMFSDPDSWTRRIKMRMLEHGIRSTIHELRHTFITNWARKGLNPLALRLIARHADLATTLRYTHLSTEDLRKEMESVDRK